MTVVEYDVYIYRWPRMSKKSWLNVELIRELLAFRNQQQIYL